MGDLNPEPLRPNRPEKIKRAWFAGGIICFALLIFWANPQIAAARLRDYPSAAQTERPPSTAAPTNTTAWLFPFITVNDQDASTGVILVEEVAAPQRGWVVIFNEVDTMPGGVIGYTLVPFGLSQDVMVEIDLTMATPRLYAALYRDIGAAEVFEPNQDERIIEAVPFDVMLPTPVFGPYDVIVMVETELVAMDLKCVEGEPCRTVTPVSIAGMCADDPENTCELTTSLLCREGACSGSLDLQPCGDQPRCTYELSDFPCTAESCSAAVNIQVSLAGGVPLYNPSVLLDATASGFEAYSLDLQCDDGVTCAGSTSAPGELCGSIESCEVTAALLCEQGSCTGNLLLSPCGAQDSCSYPLESFSCDAASCTAAVDYSAAFSDDLSPFSALSLLTLCVQNWLWGLLAASAASFTIGYYLARPRTMAWWSSRPAVCGVSCNCGGPLLCKHRPGHACGAPGCAPAPAGTHAHCGNLGCRGGCSGSCTLAPGHAGPHSCTHGHAF